MLDIENWKDLDRWAVYFDSFDRGELHTHIEVKKPTSSSTRLFIDLPVSSVKLFRKIEVEGDGKEGKIIWESDQYSLIEFEILLGEIAPPKHYVSLEFSIIPKKFLRSPKS